MFSRLMLAPIRWLIITLLILTAIYAITRPIQLMVESRYFGDRAPYLQMVSSSGVTIHWQSSKVATGTIRYGLRPEKLDKKIEEKKARRIHKLRLDNLLPATRYYYQVELDGRPLWQDDPEWFVTAPVPGSDVAVRFWVLGDPGYPGLQQQQVLKFGQQWLEDNPRTPPIDLLLTTGDNAYTSGSNPEFQKGFFEPLKEWLDNTPIFPIYGNHDARRWAFFPIFEFPQNGELGGRPSATEHYYSFTQGPVHFVVLDSQASKLDAQSPMAQWLKQDLEENEQPWVVALLHHPPYTKGSHDSDNSGDSGGRMVDIRTQIVPILEQGNVDLVLSGHSHAYERSHLIGCHYGESESFNATNHRLDSDEDEDRDHNYLKGYVSESGHGGAIFAVVGSSSKLNPLKGRHPVMAYSEQVPGSLMVDIEGNLLEAYFIDHSGEVLDHFSIEKRPQETHKVCYP